MIELHIEKEKENVLLDRKEFVVKAVFEQATPSAENLKKEIAGKLKSHEDLIVIKHVYQDYGLKSARILGYVYKDKESLKKIEAKKKKTGEKKAEVKPAA